MRKTAAKSATKDASGKPVTVAPFRLLDGYGRYATPGPEAEPIAADTTEKASARHPPGL